MPTFEIDSMRMDETQFGMVFQVVSIKRPSRTSVFRVKSA
jgi:hypothetical protein